MVYQPLALQLAPNRPEGEDRLTGERNGKREEASRAGAFKEGKEGGNEAEKTKEEREEPGSGAGRRTEARVGPSNETEQ